MNSSVFPEDSGRLAELLAARLCHDLAGTAGAIATGIDVLVDPDGGIDHEMLDLFSASAQALVARVKFYRAAFGPASSEGGRVLIDLAQAFITTGNALKPSSNHVVLTVHPQADLGILRGEKGRFVLLAILAALDCLPTGGTIGVGLSEDQVTISATGARVVLSPALAHIAPIPDPKRMAELLETPRAISVYVLQACAIRLGGSFAIRDEDGAIHLSLV